MASFTIRVELHDATWDNYVALAKDLASKGITDVIKADNGTRYRMPPAEYNYEGNTTIADVYAAANASAATTGRRHAVLVTESVRRQWGGLASV